MGFAGRLPGFSDACKTTCGWQHAGDLGAFCPGYISCRANGRPVRLRSEARLMVDPKVGIDAGPKNRRVDRKPMLCGGAVANTSLGDGPGHHHPPERSTQHNTQDRVRVRGASPGPHRPRERSGRLPGPTSGETSRHTGFPRLGTGSGWHPVGGACRSHQVLAAMDPADRVRHAGERHSRCARLAVGGGAGRPAGPQAKTQSAAGWPCCVLCAPGARFRCAVHPPD